MCVVVASSAVVTESAVVAESMVMAVSVVVLGSLDVAGSVDVVAFSVGDHPDSIIEDETATAAWRALPRARLPAAKTHWLDPTIRLS